ncbi:MAG: hypothetical protein AAFN51_01160 [Pseudomonadota bacterium]
MQIDLNGMYYIVNLTPGRAGSDLMAEIVDEAFCGPVRRAPVSSLGDMVRLIRQYTGMKPDADTLSDLSGYLEAHLDRAMEVAGEQVVLQQTA